ncbi:MAG: Hint domain-containing protein, partial [Deltaproteobacteria bacterium]
DAERPSLHSADWERVPFRDALQVIAGDVALLGRGADVLILRKGDTDLLIDTRGGLDHSDTEVSVAPLLITAQASGPLFAKGTLLRTPNGAQAVQFLDPGDLVMTRDHGAQVLVNCAAHDLGDMRLHVIKAGAAGDHLPLKDLVVTAGHGVILRSSLVQQVFRLDDILVPARLLGAVSAVSAQVGYAVTFATPQIVYANGIEVEAAGQATGHLPLRAQGRRARRLVIGLAESGAAWVDALPDAKQLAAE